jgi:hypothetical protein
VGVITDSKTKRSTIYALCVPIGVAATGFLFSFYASKQSSVEFDPFLKPPASAKSSVKKEDYFKPAEGNGGDEDEA